MFQEMIDRALNTVVPKLLEFFPSVGLIGFRQVGKTTFVKNYSL